jgi:NADH:ubiquinone oxidoreductase subunit H
MEPHSDKVRYSVLTQISSMCQKFFLGGWKQILLYGPYFKKVTSLLTVKVLILRVALEL